MPGDPERLGGCWLAARLGAGGRGVVYDAYDDEGRRFAVTVPRGEVGHRYERVTCRHLAEVVSVGSDGGVPYVVSEFVDGPDLRQAVALHGPYTGDELVALAGALAEVLRALHEAGLTHRGLNPESVLLADDGPKVIELGLPVSGPVGAYTYQAPEVLTGQAAESAADVFAWGAVVLFAATGHDPFCGESLGGIMHRLLTVDPDLSCLPDSLCDLVGRALAKDPADRPTAAELLVGGEAEPPAEGGAELPVKGRAGLCPPEAYVRQPSLGELAEEVYARLTPAQQQEVPGLLLRLLDGDTPHDEGDVLRPLMEAGLVVRRSVRVPAVETSAGKLVAVSDDRVAPASAALYRAWPRLRGWVADEREGMAVHRHIREAATTWSQRRRGRGLLLRGQDLDTALGWAATKRRHVRLNQLERDFINDSVTLSKQRRKLRVPVLATVAAVLAVAVTMTVVSVHGQNDLRERLIQADARAVAARAEALRPADPRTAMRLSVAAWRLAPVFEARAALQASLVQPELGVFTDPDADARARYLLRGDTLVKWEAGAVTVWDVPARRRVASYVLPAGVAALSDDGRYAEAVGGGPIDVTTGRPPAETVYAISRGNRTRVYRGTRTLLDVKDAKVTVSPDGARAAVSRRNGRVELWDLAARRPSRAEVVVVDPVTGADAAAPALAFSPDGRTLAVAGRDGVTLVGGDDERTGAAEKFGAAVEPGPGTPAELGRDLGASTPAPGVLALPAPTPAQAQPSAPAASQAPTAVQAPTASQAAAASRTPAAGASEAASASQAPQADASQPAGASQAPAASASQAPRASQPASVAQAPAAGASQSADGSRTAAPQTRATGAAQPDAGGGDQAGGPDDAGAGRPGSGDPQASRTGDGEAARTRDAEAARAQGSDAARAQGSDAARAQDGEAARSRNDQAKRPDSDTKGGTTGGPWGVVDGLETTAGTSAGPLVFSPDGHLLALPGDGEVRVWNVTERRLSGSYPLKDPGHGLSFSSDGHQLRYLSGVGSVVSLDVSGLPAPDDDGHVAAFSGNGRVAAKEVGNAIELTDTEERRKLGRIAAAGDLAFDAAGRLLAVAGDPVTVWEVAGGRQVATVQAGGDVPAVALSPDGGTLATARGSTLETWDVRTGRRVKEYPGAGDLALAFSPDGSTLAAGRNLLDLPTGRITPLDLTDGTAPVALAFSPDGGRLAIALEGGRVLLWDVREREPIGAIETGSAPVDGLRFSPGGDLLAVDAARTSLWDTGALREVGQVGSWAAGLAFSQDGRRLRGVALDGTVREVAVDPGLTAREVCARAGGALTRAEWARLIPESGYQESC
ncbi:hypothetical protein GCM10009850_100120 [Nonomuraea monospora]|uniref:Protein kinase domain-containing protein n=1 Tax=Nonomuraea monospora TaxID=568818 RepID=A0ABP5PS77_9ACTN